MGVEQYFDTTWCEKCNGPTEHYYFCAGHERDSSNDFTECQVCGWTTFGVNDDGMPPSPDWKPRDKKMTLISRVTGMLYPPSIAVKEEKQREYGALEFTNEHERASLQREFSGMLNMMGVRSSGVGYDGPKVRASRKALIECLAKQFLGEDFSYEEYC